MQVYMKCYNYKKRQKDKKCINGKVNKRKNKMLEKDFKEAFKDIKNEILNAQYDIKSLKLLYNFNDFSFSYYLNILKFTIIWSSRERYNITNILHTS